MNNYFPLHPVLQEVNEKLMYLCGNVILTMTDDPS